MDNSPRGHEIRKISGDGGTITQRGSEMESLGLQMRESAALLRAIVDGAKGKGYSIDSLKETAGEVHADLAKAGERYEPSGRVIRQYGEAMSSVQSRIDTIVDNCVELWSAYQSASGSFGDASTRVPPTDETATQSAQREQELDELRGSRDAAYDAWEAEARKYDDPYDTWDEAYDRALNGLEDANDRGVEDSFWDNALPAIEVILTVLTFVGVALAIAAIVIGGPFILLAAAIVGLAALALTVWKVAAGRGGWQDILIAAIGVFPFGRLAKLGTLFKGAGTFASRFGTFAKGFGSDLVGISAFRELRALRGLQNFLHGPVTNSAGNLTQSRGILNQIASVRNSVDGISYTGLAGWSRITGGSSAPISNVLSDVFAGAGPAVTNRVNGALAGTVLDGAQHGNGAVDIALNVIDSVPKPGYGAYNDIDGMIGDAGDAADADRWAGELARSGR
ncbi:hypothetical protein [Agromyces lapidis]|uniref:WXG100 family type VII secretion target n=1 Tax=Agromyces lapidis TaxID=279574 RepID=A0ABV5SNE3_9MICO|nr:hypothetical protein [Agromyces lapidis]